VEKRAFRALPTRYLGVVRDAGCLQVFSLMAFPMTACFLPHPTLMAYYCGGRTTWSHYCGTGAPALALPVFRAPPGIRLLLTLPNGRELGGFGAAGCYYNCS